MSKPTSGVLAFLTILAAGGIVLAQTGGGTPATPATQPKASDLKITLMDGSVLAGKLSVNDLTIETKYGTLKVPVDQIQSFMPGLGSHPAFQQKINEYVGDLSADTFSDREKAQQALLKIGPDIKSELERQLKGAEAEKANRLQVILDEFSSQAGGDDEPSKSPGWLKEDVIVTQGFTVVGRITTGSFSVSSQYGTLNLKLEDVRQAMREGQEKEDLRKNVAVTGMAFASRQYTTTNLRVAKGDQIVVTASGTLMMTPWGNNQQSTPDGASNFGQIASPQGVIFGGTLVGRIGEGGPMIKLGSKATIVADRPGVLQLGIASQGDYPSYNFPGEYQVKIRIVKK